MPFRQPFRAVPIKLGRHYRNKRRLRNAGTIAVWVCAAIAIGGMAGIISIAAERTDLSAAAKSAAVSLGLMRQRAPQPGDYWTSCRAARAAGTAPIYADEPGYREQMDYDSDGIACEPYRKRISTRLPWMRLHL